RAPPSFPTRRSSDLGSLYVGSGTGGHLITASDMLGGGYAISGAVVTYLPSLDYFGGDSFNFVANDTHVDSAPATISINVRVIGRSEEHTSELQSRFD